MPLSLPNTLYALEKMNEEMKGIKKDANYIREDMTIIKKATRATGEDAKTIKDDIKDVKELAKDTNTNIIVAMKFLKEVNENVKTLTQKEKNDSVTNPAGPSLGELHLFCF